MSLANPNDIIIPNTVGPISQAAKEANDLLQSETPVEYINRLPNIHRILQGRINGEKLDKLVDPKRISNSSVRETTTVETQKNENNEEKHYNGHSAYEALGRE